jgi:hypothetical protein
MGNSSSSRSPPPNPNNQLTAEERARFQADREKCQAAISQQEADLDKTRQEILEAKKKADKKAQEDAVAAQVNRAIGDAMGEANLLNKLNSLAKLVTCDAECQRSKQLEVLRQRFDYWTRTLQEAPEEVAQTEQALVTFEKGADAYNLLIFGRNTQTAADAQAKADKAHAIVKEDIDVLVRQYGIDSQLAHRVQEVLIAKTAEYVKLKQAENQLDQDKSTLGRKVAYEDGDLTKLKYFHKALLFFYYTVLFVYIVFGSYFSKAQYMNPAVWIILVNYLLFPWVAYWVTVQLFTVKNVTQHVLREVPHQNVYRNI